MYDFYCWICRSSFFHMDNTSNIVLSIVEIFFMLDSFFTSGKVIDGTSFMGFFNSVIYPVLFQSCLIIFQL